MNRKYHIVFKKDSNDFYSTGETFESNMENEVQAIIDVLNKWRVRFPLAQNPNRQFMILYPVNN